jgi:hypothetical protein
MLPLFVSSVFGLAHRAYAATVITSDQTFAEVNSRTVIDADDQMNTQGTVAAATIPGYSSTVISLYNPASLSGSFVQSRPAGSGYAYGLASAKFTADVDIPYAASGNFVSSDGDSVLISYLYDYTSNSYAFYSAQESSAGLAAFTLGGATGNYYNTFTGSLTGTLLAGHSFEWFGSGKAEAVFVVDGGAVASGFASLTFGAVPEQVSVLVWFLVAFTIGAGWWQRLRPAT